MIALMLAALVTAAPLGCWPGDTSPPDAWCIRLAATDGSGPPPGVSPEEVCPLGETPMSSRGPGGVWAVWCALTPGVVFADGFESGGVSRWSRSAGGASGL